MTAPTIKKPSITAQTIFKYAEAFAEAGTNQIDQFKKLPSGSNVPVADASNFAPMATLDSFAVELYLKCLYQLDFNQPPKRGHDFEKLFKELKPGTQKAIRLGYNEQLANHPIAAEFSKRHPKEPMDLDSCLKLSSKVFETCRYLYEGTNGKKLFYWPLLRLAVRNTIFRIKPDWA